MSPRWRKVLRDLTHQKSRTALVVLSIALGVMGMGTISGARATLSQDMQDAYLATNPRHAVIATEPFGPTLIAMVRKIPGVAEAAGRQELNARIAVGPDEWASLELVVLNDYHDMRIDKVTHLDGPWPPPRRTMSMEHASLALLGLKSGDMATIQLPNGEERHLRIGGRVHDLNQIPTVFSGELQAYITPDTLAALGQPADFNQLLITVTDQPSNRQHILSVVGTVKTQIARSGRTIHGDFVPTPGEHWAHDNAQSILFLLNIIGLLSLLLSGFLVVNTTSALMTEQIRQIGIMKAIGARRTQLIVLYMGGALLYGSLALIVAVPLGAAGAWGLTSFVSGLLNMDVANLALTPQVLRLELLVGLLTPTLAAFFPVLSGTRVTVREAINSYGLKSESSRRGLFSRVLSALRGLPRPMLLSLRNTFRRRGRLFLVCTTLTLASAIFISILSVQASLRLTLDDALRYWHYDVGVGFAQSYRVEELELVAQNAPGVEAAEGWGMRGVVRMRTATEQSDNIVMVAPPVGTTLIDPIVTDGRWLEPQDGNAVVINNDLRKEEPDLDVGDTLTLRIDGRDTEWTIVGLIHQPLAGPFIYVNYPVFAQAVRQFNQANNVRIVTTEHDPDAQAQMARQLEGHFAQNGFRVNAIRTTSQERQQTENLLNIIVNFLLVMAVLLALVGGLGLAGLLSINVLERTREVGVMRALGASNRSLRHIVTLEGMVICLLSWLAGLIVAWPLGKLLSTQVGLLFLGTPARYEFSSPGAGIWLLIILLIALIASLLPARHAIRLTVREALAYS